MNRPAMEEMPAAREDGLAEPEAARIRIRPRTGWRAIEWRELWQYREMLFFLTWRDVKVRYKQTVLGAAWAVLQPVMTMVVFTVFFGQLAKIQANGLPYPIFNYSGLLPWIFFAGIVGNAANSLIGNERLVTKVYFPRLIIPSASVGVGLVDMLVAMGFLVGLMAYYGIWPGWTFLLLPVLLAAIILCGLGVGLFLCALNVEYRDFKYVIPFMVQLWMFASPVMYPSSLVPMRFRTWYGLNPMAGLIEGYRAAVLGQAMPWELLAISVVIAMGLFLAGAAYFRRMEYKFADLI